MRARARCRSSCHRFTRRDNADPHPYVDRRLSSIDKRAVVLSLVIMAGAGHLVGRLQWDRSGMWEGSQRYLRDTNLDVITVEAIGRHHSRALPRACKARRRNHRPATLSPGSLLAGTNLSIIARAARRNAHSLGDVSVRRSDRRHRRARPTR